MCVLLGLGDTFLAQTRGADELGEDAIEIDRRAGCLEREVLAIAGHRHALHCGPMAAIEAGETREAERLAELPHAVRAVVERDHRVAVAQAPLCRVTEYDRLDELVEDVRGVALA